MIKRKAGVNVKISDVFRKRALFGVAVCCIAATELFIDYIVSYIAYFVKRNRL